MNFKTLDDHYNDIKGCLIAHAPYLFPLHTNLNIHEIRSYVNTGIMDIKKVLLNLGYVDSGKGVFTINDKPEFTQYNTVDEFDDDYMYRGYITKTKIDGKTGVLKFNECLTSKGYLYFLSFSVKNKNKDKKWKYKQSTGLTDPRFLFWAKRQLIKFEKFIIRQQFGSIKICIGWEDLRRKRVYKWGLMKIGYKEDVNEVYKYLK